MREEFLHFIWKYQRFNHRDLITTHGDSVHIIDYGHLNHGDGPDFLNAKVEIDGVIWAGHIEIHVIASDWDRHRHSDDKNYQNIILHVVYHHDKEIENTSFPTLELAGRIPKSIYDRYLSLMNSTLVLPCQHLIPEIEPSAIRLFMHRLAIERMEQKVQKIEELLIRFKNDFEQVAFVWLSRYFGQGENSNLFQELTSRIPTQWLSKIRHEKEGIAALLMGCAGFLEDVKDEEEYLKTLLYQFQHFQKKWNVQISEAYWWKWKSGRPAGFPTLKIVQLAKLIEKNQFIFQLVMDETAFRKEILDVTVHEFWNHHYHLKKDSVEKEKNLSQSFADKLVINVTVPMLLAYGRFMDDAQYSEKALDILESISPENNRITRWMSASGLSNQSALESQALLHLKKEYCDLKRCLECQIGNRIMNLNHNKLKEPDYLEEIYI